MSHFGAGYRDRLLAAARAAGCPIFSSTSGNGAHILARLAASADGVDLGRSMTLPAAGDPALTGLTVDRFLPGAKALVCVRFERPMPDITPDVPVPVLSPNDLFSLLAAGRSSHHAWGEGPYLGLAGYPVGGRRSGVFRPGSRSGSGLSLCDGAGGRGGGCHRRPKCPVLVPWAPGLPRAPGAGACPGGPFGPGGALIQFAARCLLIPVRCPRGLVVGFPYAMVPDL